MNTLISILLTSALMFTQMPMGPRFLSSGGGTGPIIQLTSYGGNCNGSFDNTAAFQAAFNDIASGPNKWINGPPVTLQLPSGVCAIYASSQHTNGASCTILSAMSNTMIAGAGVSSTTIKTINYPDTGCSFFVWSIMFNVYDRGGIPNFPNYFLTGQATAGTNSITLATPSQISNFTVGHYVALYERNPHVNGQAGPNGGTLNQCDICPHQINQIATINPNGTMTMVHNWDRTFLTYSYGTGLTINPAIADIDAQIVRNGGMKNLTMEAADPLEMEKVSDLTFTNVNLVVDQGIGSVSYPGTGSRTYSFYIDSNAVNYVTFDNVNWIINGLNGSTPYAGGEWFQDNSDHWTWKNSTFGSPTSGFTGLGFDEFSAGVNLLNNVFYTLAGNGTAAAQTFTTWDSFNGLFNGNTINQNGGNFDGANNAAMIADGVMVDCPQGCVRGVGSGTYMSYQGHSTFTNNTFNNCTVSGGGSCFFMVGPAQTINGGNHFHSTQGGNLNIYQFGESNDFQINGNFFNAPGGPVALQPSNSNNGWSFSFNTNQGPGTGVFISQPAGGTCTINMNSGFVGYSTNNCSGSGNN